MYYFSFKTPPHGGVFCNHFRYDNYSPAVSDFSRFIMDSRCLSLASFQYMRINSKLSVRINGSSALGEWTWIDLLDFVSSGIFPGSPTKKNDTGVCMARPISNKRDADMRLSALSYF